MTVVTSDIFQVMTLNPVCENVETAQGVPLTVTGVAQVTIVQLESSWIELFTLELNLLHLMVVILRIEFNQRDEIHHYSKCHKFVTSHLFRPSSCLKPAI